MDERDYLRRELASSIFPLAVSKALETHAPANIDPIAVASFVAQMADATAAQLIVLEKPDEPAQESVIDQALEVVSAKNTTRTGRRKATAKNTRGGNGELAGD